MSSLEVTQYSEYGSERKGFALESIFTPRLSQEIAAMRAEGYNVTIGSTEDRAYENPDKIVEVHNMLDVLGKEFTSQMGKLDLGRSALVTASQYVAGDKISSLLEGKLMFAGSRKQKAEELRAKLLYNTLTVQAMPWHEQNGKALALGTIVDAHDLKVVGRDGNEPYKFMSGRLTGDILTQEFRDNSNRLSGLSLSDAMVKVRRDFRGAELSAAQDYAAEKLDEVDEFTSAAVYAGFQDIVGNCTDSLGIRSRKEEVRRAINEHVEQVEKDEYLMMSVGCGTALPMLEVIDDLRRKGKNVKMILLDQDPIALAAAQQYAEQMNLADMLEIHCEELFVGKGKDLHVLPLEGVLQGRKLDVCEDSGLREYFPDFLYADLTKQAWDSLTEDGIMTTGNMNRNRPQAEFLHGLMGWPLPVRMRHIKDLARLHEKSGVPKSASRYRVTQDGVYTLCFSSKQPA